MGRYTKQDARRIMNTFNKAISRAMAKVPDESRSLIPQRASMRTLSSLTSDEDRDRMLDYLRLAHGARSLIPEQNKQGAPISKYEIALAERMVDDYNRNRIKARRKIVKALPPDKEIPKTTRKDIYIRESFDPDKYGSRESIVSRLAALRAKSNPNYFDRLNDRFVNALYKSLEHRYGLEKADLIRMQIKAKGYTNTDIAARMYADDELQPDQVYVEQIFSTGSTPGVKDRTLQALRENFGIETDVEI